MIQKPRRYLLPLYVVASLFPRLLHLPLLPPEVQLTELLFPLLLVVYGRQAWSAARRHPLLTLGVAGYCGVNLLSGLLAEYRFPDVTEDALLEACGRVYLGVMAFITIGYVRQFNRAGALRDCGGGDPQLKFGRGALVQWWILAAAVVATASLCAYAVVWAGGPNVNSWVANVEVYPYFGSVLRLRGPAQVYGMYAMLLLPPLALAAWRKRWAMAALIALASVLTLGKENLLPLIGLALYASVRARRPVPRMAARVVALVLTGVLLFATHFLITDNGGPVAQTAYVNGRVWWSGTEWSLVETNYAENKRAAWLLAAEHPVVGVGPGQFSRWTERLVARGRYPATFGRFDPHSAYTGALVETGWLGLAGLGFLIFALWRSGRGGPACGLKTVLGVVLVLFMVAGVFKDVMNYRGLWVLVGWWVAAPSE